MEVIESFNYISPSEKKKDRYESTLVFSPNISITVITDRKSGRCEVRFISGKEEQRISCIHTSVTDLKVEEYNQWKSANQMFLPCKSTENLKMDLTPETRFIAIKSWAQGLCELGLDFILSQSCIEQTFGFSPLSNQIMNFIVAHDPSFFTLYTNRIRTDCCPSGHWNSTVTLANLDLALSSETNYFIKALLELSPPLEILFQLNYWEYSDYRNIITKYIQTFTSEEIRKQHPRQVINLLPIISAEDGGFFIDRDMTLDQIKTILGDTTELKIIKNLIEYLKSRNKLTIDMFDRTHPLYLDDVKYDWKLFPKDQVLRSGSPICVGYVEDMTCDDFAIVIASGNKPVIDYLFRHYFAEIGDNQLLLTVMRCLLTPMNDEYASNLLNVITENKNLAPNGSIPPEYAWFLPSNNNDLLEELSRCEWIYTFPESQKLFMLMRDGVIPISYIKELYNKPNADLLFTSPLESVLTEVAKDERAVHHPLYSTLLDRHSLLLCREVIHNKAWKTLPRLDRVFALLSKPTKERTFALMSAVAADPRFCEYPEYEQLFTPSVLAPTMENADIILYFVYQNPASTRFAKSYCKYAMDYPWEVLLNPSAMQFRTLYNTLLGKVPELIKIMEDACTKHGKDTSASIYKTISEYLGKINHFKGIYTFPNYAKIIPYLDNPSVNINCILQTSIPNAIVKKTRYESVNPYYIYYPITLEDFTRMVANDPVILRSPNIIHLPFIDEYINTLDTHILRWDKISSLVSNPAILYYAPAVLEWTKTERTLYGIGSNPQIVWHDDLFRYALKKYPNEVALNPNACVVHPQLIRRLFNSQRRYRRDNFIDNINFPITHPDCYRKLFKTEDRDVLKNINAYRFPEYMPLVRKKLGIDAANNDTLELFLGNPFTPLAYPSDYRFYLTALAKRWNGYLSHAMWGLAMNPNIGLHASTLYKLLHQYPLSRECVAPLLASPYLAHTPILPYILKRCWNLFNEEDFHFLAINPEALRLPSVQKLLLPTLPYNFERDHHLSSLAENTALGTVCPKLAWDLLHSNNYRIQSYAFRNPSLFPILFPRIQKALGKTIRNTHLMPDFYNGYHTLYYHRAGTFYNI